MTISAVALQSLLTSWNTGRVSLKDHKMEIARILLNEPSERPFNNLNEQLGSSGTLINWEWRLYQFTWRIDRDISSRLRESSTRSNRMKTGYWNLQEIYTSRLYAGQTVQTFSESFASRWRCQPMFRRNAKPLSRNRSFYAEGLQICRNMSCY